MEKSINEETINERFKRFFISLGISNVDFAKKVKAKPNEVTNWKSHTPINHDRLENILNVYEELNARWLITGKGEMFENKTDKSNYEPEEIPMINVQDPTSPFEYDCGNILCRMEKKHLMKDIKRLEHHISDLTRKEGGCSPGEIEGGVEKSRNTG